MILRKVSELEKELKDREASPKYADSDRYVHMLPLLLIVDVLIYEEHVKDEIKVLGIADSPEDLAKFFKDIGYTDNFREYVKKIHEVIPILGRFYDAWYESRSDDAIFSKLT